MTPVYLFPPRTRRPPGYSTSPRQRAAGPHHLHVVYQQGAPFSDTGRVHNMFTIDRNKSLVNFTGSDVLRLQKPNHASLLHSRRELISARSLSQPITLTTWKSLQYELHQATVHTLLNTPHDSSAKIKHLRGLYAQTFLTF